MLLSDNGWICHKGKIGHSSSNAGFVDPLAENPLHRKGEGWVVGSGEPMLTYDDIVKMAKAEAVVISETEGELMAFSVNPMGGVQFYKECFNMDGNLDVHSLWDTYVYDVKAAKEEQKEREIEEEIHHRKVEKSAEILAAEEAEALRLAEEAAYWEVEDDWVRHQSKTEKVYCVKEAESYYKAAIETVEELEAELTSAAAKADEAFSKYTRMIAKGQVRAVPLVRPSKAPQKFDPPDRSAYIYKVAFVHQGVHELPKDETSEQEARARSDSRGQRRLEADEQRERERIAEDKAREEREAAAAAARYEKEAQEAKAAARKAADLAAKARAAQATASAAEMKKLEEELEEAKRVAAEEKRQAEVAKARMEKERLEAEEAARVEAAAEAERLKQEQHAKELEEEEKKKNAARKNDMESRVDAMMKGM